MTNLRPVWAAGDFKTSLFYAGSRSLKIKRKRKTGECGSVSWLLCIMSQGMGKEKNVYNIL